MFITGPKALTQALSEEFSTKAIYFYFGDASGWMGYKLFENGEEVEEYSFGMSYEEEMEEMGVTQPYKEGTVITNDEQDNQYLFWSKNRNKTAEEITSGEKFIDDFLCEEQAYIGWDLMSEKPF